MSTTLTPSASPVFASMAAAAILVPKKAESPEVLALIPAALDALRARRLNTVEKRDLARASLDCIVHYGCDVSHLCPLGTNPTREEREALRQAHNNQVWAERAALEQSARECDLTPERAARLRAGVARDLPRWREYRAAVEIIQDFEGDYGKGEEPAESPIIAKVKAAAKERLENS